jgi:hypothetical protein
MTEEEELLIKIFGYDGSDSLSDALPCGYTENGMGRNDEVDSLLKIPVLRTHTNFGEDGPTWPKPWPGPESPVDRWYELENGKAVGWVMSDPWKFVVRDL